MNRLAVESYRSALMDAERECALLQLRVKALEAILRELVESEAINMYGPAQEWPITGAKFADLYERVEEVPRG